MPRNSISPSTTPISPLPHSHIPRSHSICQIGLLYHTIGITSIFFSNVEIFCRNLYLFTFQIMVIYIVHIAYIQPYKVSTSISTSCSCVIQMTLIEYRTANFVFHSLSPRQQRENCSQKGKAIYIIAPSSFPPVIHCSDYLYHETVSLKMFFL